MSSRPLVTPIEVSSTSLAPRLPTLSVVMPNYNHARYLETALRAHLEQTVPPLEILVVDDGSTDDSCAVVERVAACHPSVRLVRLTRNYGVVAAMNRGLGEARGDYICFSAADDVVTRAFVERTLQCLALYPTSGLGFSDPAELVGGSGMVYRLPLLLSERPCMLSSTDIERSLKRSYFSFPGHAVVYRRAPLVALGGFIEELHWYADWFASCVLAFRHGACYVPEVLAFFRVSPDSYSARGLRRKDVQRQLVYRVLDLLESSAFRDVARQFRASALLPEFRGRVLLWLLASPRYRSYLTARLVVRLAVRGLWSVLKPRVPGWVRPAARHLARQWARRSA
jgi:glycosyltransferase involved in cell wall biosynthesis